VLAFNSVSIHQAFPFTSACPRAGQNYLAEALPARVFSEKEISTSLVKISRFAIAFHEVESKPYFNPKSVVS